jgi:hypothetical protein
VGASRQGVETLSISMHEWRETAEEENVCVCVCACARARLAQGMRDVRLARISF